MADETSAIAKFLLLTGLIALAIFIFTPEAERFARSPAFLPILLCVLGGFALFSVGRGLLKGSIQPLVKGYSKTFERAEEPKRYWASVCWNASAGLLCGWAAFATIVGQDEERCFNRQNRYTPQEELDACTNLLVAKTISKTERADILAARGQAYHRLGDYAAAFDDYDNAISLDPSDSYSLYNRALIHERLGDPDSALLDFNNSLKLRPINFEGYLNRGYVFSNTGRFDEAISDFTQAHKLDPGNEWPIASRGMAHLYKGEEDLALHDFAAAKKVNPVNPVLLRGEAMMSMHAGDFQQAADKLSEALKINPSDSWTLKLRSDAYWQLGETEKSRNDDDRRWELSERSTKSQRTEK